MKCAGQLDRFIEYAALVHGEDDAAAPIAEPAIWQSLWAAKEDVQVSNEVAEMQHEVAAIAVFVVDFIEWLHMPGIVRYEGKTYRIKNLEEVGFKQFMRIHCVRTDAFEAV